MASLKRIAPGSHIERNQDFFDSKANDSEAETAFASDQRTKVATIARLLSRLTPRSRVAEVGSFTGYAAVEYSSIPGVEIVTCFDLSPNAVEGCRSRGFQAEVWNADKDPCPAADAAFDVVLAPDVIEHLLNTETFLHELRRVCTPQGHLILSTPNLAFWLNRLRLLMGRVPWSYPGVSSHTKLDSAIDLNHLRINTQSEWTNLLQVCCWRVERVLAYSLLDDQPKSPKMILLGGIDRLAGLVPGLAFGHIYVASPAK